MTGNLSGDDMNRTHRCVALVPNTQPPPAKCDGRGNPILPSTGQKFQIETDYVSGSGGLQFLRTYRSNKGLFSSVLDSA
jgi:hypothetical protein